MTDLPDQELEQREHLAAVLDTLREAARAGVVSALEVERLIDRLDDRSDDLLEVLDLDVPVPDGPCRHSWRGRGIDSVTGSMIRECAACGRNERRPWTGGTWTTS